MAGLIADLEQVHAPFDRSRHEPGTQGMGAEGCGIERQARSAGLHDIGDDASRETLGTDALRSPIPHPAEQRAFGNAGSVQPRP